MNYKKILLILIIIFAAGVILLLIRGDEDTWLCQDGQWVKYGQPASPPPTSACAKNEIKDFWDCINSGYPALESYPRQCRAGDEVFIEEIGNELDKINLIRLNNPRPNQMIASPLIIEGQARGTWFFEGDFPIILTNWDGLIIAEGYAQAQEDPSHEDGAGWMSEDFVKFKAELNFNKPEYNNRGSLILRKDNPSGLPENDDALETPVFFK